MNYSEVFKSLATCSDVRDRILTFYREIGGDYHHWLMDDQLKMCLAITKIEDEIEDETKNQEHRTTLKLVRRALENELEG